MTFDAADGVTAIDTLMVGHAGVTSAYLVDAAEPAIVETGPTTSRRAVLDGLRKLGVGANDLAHIIVTHIHLDHAGGAGALATRFPNATVWAHERGAPHLADPTKLVASAARVYGDEELKRMFGSVEPVPTARLRSVADGDDITLGDRALSVLYAPGHASHQVCFLDSRSGSLFTGDALGVFLRGVGVLRPATPPPEFDLELAVESVRRVQRVGPSSLLFSHFGPAVDVDGLCDLAVERLESWTAHVRRAMLESEDLDVLTQRLGEATKDEFAAVRLDRREYDRARYEVLSSVRMNAMGISRYLRTRVARA